MKLLLKFLTLALAIVVLVSSPALAAKQSRGSVSNLGNDISYPQCNKSLPSGQAFGIVGVNGGLANTTNPCLGTQLVWSNKSTGLTYQTRAQLYVNTANPGGLNTASWPQSNTDPSGAAAPNPYGTCDGNDTLACGWQYGWNRAVEDVQQRFGPAAGAAGAPTNPTSYPWWLDVETTNTWKSGSSFGAASNRADLEGMVTYFKSIGAGVGLYSTSYQWGQIAGSVGPGSNLNGLDNWRPGARNSAGAKSNCSLAPLTAGGRVTTTQYVSNSFDYDYSCL